LSYHETKCLFLAGRWHRGILTTQSRARRRLLYE
jgi:hypothetical protein